MMTHQQNMKFQQELLQQKAAFEQKLKDEQDQASVNNKISGAKLPKLPITKFNGKFESWLPFWGKFDPEADIFRSKRQAALDASQRIQELLEDEDADSLC